MLYRAEKETEFFIFRFPLFLTRNGKVHSMALRPSVKSGGAGAFSGFALTEARKGEEEQEEEEKEEEKDDEERVEME